MRSAPKPSPTALGRDRRHQTSVAIRKRGRDSRVAAQRNAGNAPTELPVSEEELQQLKRFGVPQLVKDFRSGTPAILRATMATRKLLSTETEPLEWLIDSMVGLGLMNDLCNALDRHDSPRLQFEALWGITNAASRRPDAIVRTGALPKIVQLLDAKGIPIRELALWSLGNIMSKSNVYRNQCISLGAAKRISSLFSLVYTMTPEDYEQYCRENEQPDSLQTVLDGVTAVPISRQNFIRQATWALSSLLRGGDTADEVFGEVCNTLPFLRELLLGEDPYIVANCLWVLADFAEKFPKLVLELGITDRIVELGLHPYLDIQGASAHCISNMCTNDGQCLRALTISRRADMILVSQLRLERSELWVNASWTLSFICAELQVCCERMLQHYELFFAKISDQTIASEIRQDCAIIVTMCFTTRAGVELLATSEKPLLALIQTLRVGVERDINLTGQVLLCTLIFLQKGGTSFLRAFEEYGGIEFIRRIERALDSSRHKGDQSLIQTALETIDQLLNHRDEDEHEMSYMFRASPVRAVLSKNMLERNSLRTSMQE